MSIYIGGDIIIPGSQEVITINNSNIAQYFTVENSSYYFADGDNNGSFISNNAGKNSTTAATSLVPLVDIPNFSFKYQASADSGDLFTIASTDSSIGTIYNSYGTTAEKTFTGSLKAGTRLVFKYTKDASGASGTDNAWFYDVCITNTITPVEKYDVAFAGSPMYVGVNGVARKALKAYIGVNNVARLFYDISLPYIPLNYIQSNGTQYIDTGFIPNQDTRVVANVESTSTSGQQSLFGGRLAYGQKDFSFWLNNGVWLSNYNTASNSISGVITGKHKIDKNKNTTTLDSSTTATATYAAFTAPNSMYIFGCNQNGTLDSRVAYMKLYSFQIYDNGTLVRDFIPVQMKDTNAVGLWDKVNKKFYANAGTGSFISA